MRKTLIDLTKMDQQSRMFYLRDLLIDLVNKDLDQDLLNHAQQAIIDLEELSKTKEG